MLIVLIRHLMEFPFEGNHLIALDRAISMVAGFGFAGVDLFFVLSGYLITGILLAAKESPHYFRNFYARRILRIFPLYFLFLFFAFHVLPRFARHSEHFVIPHGFLEWPFWTFLSNFYLVSGRPSTSVVAITWSLAIEEQFYIVWPLVIFLCSRRAAVAVTGAIVITAIGYRSYYAIREASFGMTYFTTFARMDGLAIGCAVALLQQSPKHYAVAWAWARRLWPALLGVAVLIIVVGQLRHHEVRAFVPGQMIYYTIIDLLFAIALIGAIQNRPALLRAAPFRFFGRYSFALYLIHQPVQFWVETHWPATAAMRVGPSFAPFVLARAVVELGIAVVLSMASWYLIEANFLKLKRFFPERPVPIPTPVSATTVSQTA